MLAHAPSFRAAAIEPRAERPALEFWLADDVVQRVLQVNQADGAWWFRKEAWEQWLARLALIAQIEPEDSLPSEARAERARRCRSLAERMTEAGREAGYRLDRLVALVTADAAAVTKVVGPGADRV